MKTPFNKLWLLLSLLVDTLSAVSAAVCAPCVDKVGLKPCADMSEELRPNVSAAALSRCSDASFTWPKLLVASEATGRVQRECLSV